MTEETIITMAGIGLAAWLCQWFAWWVKTPAILPLLLVGVLVGPVFGLLDPEALLGDLLFPMVSLAVAVILFEGGLTLRFSEIRGLEKVVRNLVTGGLLVTWVITTVATRLILDFSWELSFLFGAFTVVTGPTVIVPMLRTVRPTARIANILRWEGIVIDPIGALLSVLVFEFIISSGDGLLGHTLLTFTRTIVIGLLFGAVGGYFFGILLRRHLLPEYLHNIGALALTLAVFAFSNHLQEESGLLAVTIMGIWLANMRGVRVDDILDFKESLSVLLISVLFIVLAARIEFSQIVELGWGAVWIFLAIQFIARPLKAHISSIGSTLTWPERHMLCWIAPRGIVAAAIAALFSLRLEQAGYPEANLLVPLTFIVIIGTVVLQSLTAGFIARALGVAEPEPLGFLIVGAGPVARALAKGLQSREFRVLLVDTGWENLRDARMEGLPTFYGSPVSEMADRHLDLVGVGRLLALSPQGDLNTLASLRYRNEFGRQSVYSLLTSAEQKTPEKHKTAGEHKGTILFDNDVTYAKLASLISQGATIKFTQLSEEFAYQMYLEQYGDRAIPLFAFTPQGLWRPFTSDDGPSPEKGWTIMSLIRKEENQHLLDPVR